MVTRQRKNKDKDKNKAPKVVWRISAAAPLGEYVHSQPDAPADAAAAAAAKAKLLAASADGEPKELPERGWHHSTHELVQGLDMSEESIDTLPDDLFDQYFKTDPPRQP
jgi:hypothetical protein